MTESHYEKFIKDSLEKFRDLTEKRQQADIELAKLRQFLFAVLNMVSDEQRAKWEGEINSAVRKATTSSASLTDSIRKVFQEGTIGSYTAGAIRQLLDEAGFDFSAYRSNPISSISTTLRRMVETGELDTHEDAEGTTLYALRFPDEPTPAKQKANRISRAKAALRKK
jgi:hypothetical protein